MKTNKLILTLAVLLSLAFTTPLHAQTSAFTYQGSLTDNGSPANGSYDLRFALYNDAGAGALQGDAITNSAVALSNGLFTVTLDFGAVVFDGSDRWLEIGVTTNGGGAFSTLSPRQLLTATPYAIQAANSASAEAVSGTVDSSQLTGTISSNNIAAGSISSAMLADGAVGTSQLADDAVTADKLITTFGGSTLTQSITNPAPADVAFSGRFGIAVSSVGNDKLLIGADGARPNNGSLQLSGAAYVYDIDGTLLTTITNPTPAGFDYFGNAVSGVGNDKVLIGAYNDDTGAGAAGAAYLYDIGGTLLITYTNPSPVAGDRFGGSVSGVGSDKVLIAAYRDDTGADAAGIAYLYDTNGTLLTTYTNPTPANGDLFGISVSGVGSDKVIIGAFEDDTGAQNAGAAYLYDTSGTLLTTYIAPFPANPFSGDRFGSAVSSVGDDKVLIGASSEDNGVTTVGAAYLYDLSGTLLMTIANPTPSFGDKFGDAVSGVGNDKLLIGASWDDTGTNNAGAAYLYDLNGILLATYTNPTPASDDNFGIAVSGVGSDKVLVGAYRDDQDASSEGAAYLYDVINYTPGLVAEDVKPGSITSLQIADGTVTTAEIADGTITTGDLDSNVLSGTFWRLDGNAGTIPGTHFLGTTDNQALEFKVNNLRGLRLEYASGVLGTSVNIVGGDSGNFLGSGVVGATIAGGGKTSFGDTNRVLGDFGTIGGGLANTASGLAATIAGGANNTASGAGATVGGGDQNTASGGSATVGGGVANSANGESATVPGGILNSATNYSFAAGRQAKANHTGAFVWADSTAADFASTSSNQFLIRASGGVGIGTANPGATVTISRPVQAAAHQLELRNEGSIQSPNFDGIRFTQDADGGTELASINVKYFNTGKPDLSFSVRDRPDALFIHGNHNSRGGNVGIGTTTPTNKLDVVGNVSATSFITTSDRDSKENFKPVSPQQVLAKVVDLPISQWNFKTDTDTPHLGPMAQDFHAAFGVGPDDKHIATVDADGVALAAIQGLNQKVEDGGQKSEDRMRKLETENAELKESMNELKQLVKSMNQQLNGGAK